MKRATRILAAVMLLFLGVGEVRAALIVGPTAFPIVGGNDASWGIQFTALQSATLTGYDYHHNPTTFGNPFSGTISLNDLTSGTTVYSAVYGPNSPAVMVFSGLTIALNSGDIYQLVATSNKVSNANDEVYAYLSTSTPALSFPTSNADISVTKGVFSANPGFQETHAWAAFGNLTTAHAGESAAALMSVPEPSSLALLGIGMASVTGYTWRRSRRTRPPA